MHVVAIIPARAGSKGIKDKNIINFCGKPLLAWSIQQAKKSRHIDDVYVSTDGRKIAKIAEDFGAEVVARPDDISGDFATSESALLHAISEIEKKETIDAVVFLQATSPLRKQGDIDAAIEKFIGEKLDSLFSVAVLDDYCIWENKNEQLNSLTYDYKNRGRRQERNPYYLENGSIYIFKPEVIKKYNNRLGGKIGMYEMPFNQSFEIDTPQDIYTCKIFMENMLQQKGEA